MGKRKTKTKKEIHEESDGTSQPSTAGREARQRASVILEVLAGTMTPSSAAKVLGCSSARYYGLEAKALEGMVAACEPRPVGYVKTPERELAKLKKENARLERECSRYQSLCRAAQRAAGISAASVKRAKSGGRKRKPTVRALKLAEKLRDGDDSATSTEGAANEQGKTG